jgi:hypothetical protein
MACPWRTLKVAMDFLGFGGHRMLSGDGRELSDAVFERFRVLGGIADADVDDDLLKLRALHDAGVAEFLDQGRAPLALVLLDQTVLVLVFETALAAFFSAFGAAALASAFGASALAVFRRFGFRRGGLRRPFGASPLSERRP